MPCTRNTYLKADAIAIMRDRERDGSVRLDIHLCEECNGWHLNEMTDAADRPAKLKETTNTISE